MLLAMYKTAKETYELLREKCCPKKKINMPPKEDDGNPTLKDLKASGPIEAQDLEVISLNSEDQIEKVQNVGFGNLTKVNHLDEEKKEA